MSAIIFTPIVNQISKQPFGSTSTEGTGFLRDVMNRSKDDNTEFRQPKLSDWLMRPAIGWHRKSIRFFLGHLSKPITLLAVILALTGVLGYEALLHPNYATTFYIIELGLLILGVIILGIFLRRVNRQLLEPLAHMRNWAIQMRGGNLSARIPVPDKGEFADLARDINNLGEEFKSLALQMNAKVRKQTERIGRKTRSLDILYDISSSLNQSRNLDEMLDNFLDTFMELMDARAATVRLLADNSKTKLVASRGLDASTVERDALRDINRCKCGLTNNEGIIRIQQGVHRCLELSGLPILDYPCSELVVVPVQYRDKLLGEYNLYLDRPVLTLGEDVQEMLGSIGKHLGIAIEKSRLDDQAHRLAIMEERNMLGNELHDSLAQSLVGMRLQVKMLGETLFKKDLRTAQSETRRLRLAVEQAHLSLRELLANFRLKIDERGLVEAISNSVQRFKEETGISVFFHNECGEPRLTPAQEIQVFYIIQEALTNIRKHSHARNVRILLNGDDNGNYSLLVEDDGNGMDQKFEGMPGEHLGLSIMHERAERLPGELTIDSEPGEGTRIYLRFSSATSTGDSSRAYGR